MAALTAFPDKLAGGGLGPLHLRSLAERVADAIVSGIAAGVLQPGQRIVEGDIARQLGVSRVPVREAVKTLEAQGILDCTPHRAARIVEFDEDKIDRICEVRAELEKIAIRHALKTYAADPAALARLDAIIDGMAQCARRDDWPGVNQADIAFHLEICAASRNEIVMTLWQTLARHVLIIFGREILSEGDRTQIVEQHRALRRALQAGDREKLERDVEGHIMRLRRAAQQRRNAPAAQRGRRR